MRFIIQWSQDYSHYNRFNEYEIPKFGPRVFTVVLIFNQYFVSKLDMQAKGEHLLIMLKKPKLVYQFVLTHTPYAFIVQQHASHVFGNSLDTANHITDS